MAYHQLASGSGENICTGLMAVKVISAKAWKLINAIQPSSEEAVNTVSYTWRNWLGGSVGMAWCGLTLMCSCTCRGCIHIGDVLMFSSVLLFSQWSLLHLLFYTLICFLPIAFDIPVDAFHSLISWLSFSLFCDTFSLISFVLMFVMCLLLTLMEIVSGIFEHSLVVGVLFCCSHSSLFCDIYSFVAIDACDAFSFSVHLSHFAFRAFSFCAFSLPCSQATCDEYDDTEYEYNVLLEVTVGIPVCLIHTLDEVPVLSTNNSFEHLLMFSFCCSCTLVLFYCIVCIYCAVLLFCSK